MSTSDLRVGLGRASAGESEACQRRDRHGADADQRRGGVGAVVGEEVAGAGARGEDQAADGAVRSWHTPYRQSDDTHDGTSSGVGHM